MKDITIAIDFGASTVKVAYAYVDKGVHSGKLAPKDNNSPYSSLCYYDEDSEKWYFAEEFLKLKNINFKNIVKINSLLSLLLDESNYEYYNNLKFFPKFCFPEKKELSNNYAELINNELAFEANKTPKEVCEAFVVNLFEEYIAKALSELAGYTSSTKVNYVVIYPLKATKSYTDNLISLIKNATECNDIKCISATKAISLYAYKTNTFGERDKVLIVNTGEKELSVSKVFLMAMKDSISIIVDGADAHNDPINIGGEDFDADLNNLIRRKIGLREILGDRADKSHDRVDEVGTHRQQYVLSKNIQNMKKYFSCSNNEYNRAFKNGVPIIIEKDVYVQTNVKKSEYAKMYLEPMSAAKRMAKYIIAELQRPTNSDVNKIIIAGGVSESYMLKDFIYDQIKFAIPGSYCTIENMTDLDIADDENEIYASSIGAAIFGTDSIKIETHPGYFYGTWVIEKEGKKYFNQKVFKPFRKLDDLDTPFPLRSIISKNTVIPPEGLKVGILLKTIANNNQILGEEFFAADECYEKFSEKYISMLDEINSPNVNAIRKTFLKERIQEPTPYVVGEIGSYEREQASQRYGLKSVTGGENAVIQFVDSRTNTLINNLPEGIIYEEGIFIDADGRAKPFAEISQKRNGMSNKISKFFTDSINRFKNPELQYLEVKIVGLKDFGLGS